jgi:hypothetical protein
MKEALSSSETSVLTRATRRNIPEDTILHSHGRENLKSYVYNVYIQVFPKAIHQRLIANVKVLSVADCLDVLMCRAQEWNDYNLRWNESEFGGVKDLRITPNKIWRPDILMYNR